MSPPEREIEPRPRLGPYDSTQFLLMRSRSARRQIENDEGEAVLLTAGPQRTGQAMRVAAVVGLLAVAYAAAPVLETVSWLYVVALPAAVRLLLVPRRTAAFYDAETRQRLVELRPEPGRWRARHRLVDDEGRLIARFELALFRATWTARDAEGQIVCVGYMVPRRAAWMWLGRGRWLRWVALSVAPGALSLGHVERRSPDFDGHDLLDLTADRHATLDRRVAVALAILIG